MRYLGIDYGTKRVGCALSTESGDMAFPHEVLKNDDDLLQGLAAIVKEYDVAEIVVGHSRNADGVDNKVQKLIDAFIIDFTLEVGLPIHTEGEQYSTQEALRFQGRNDKTDASAAAVILNSYITRIKNTHD